MERGRDPFAAVTVATQRSAYAPSWPALAALALAAASVLLVPMATPLGVAIGGYVVAALLAPGLVVLHRAFERRAQQNPRYVRRTLPRRIAAFAIVTGLAAGTAHAWIIATELAKR
jgi:hypothetical protein